MSWLARSLANSLLPPHDDDDDDGDEGDDHPRPNPNPPRPPPGSAAATADEHGVDPVSPTRGVKEDISELTKTLTRQLWGVASFLAPPPQSHTPTAEADEEPSDQDREASDSSVIAGIRSDIAEIGGRFRTGISKISGHKAVSEISKIASTFIPFGSEDDDDDAAAEEERSEARLGGGGGGVGGSGVIGVTEEVITFARNISKHPETWLDFPLLPEEDDFEDFDMSDAQQEHALAVERLLPRLAALRIELCPSHMSEDCFWKIYFVLLHPRLNKQDAELLSTPQIVEARAMLQRLQNQTKLEKQAPTIDLSYKKPDQLATPEDKHFSASRDTYESLTPNTQETKATFPEMDLETEKHPILTMEKQVIDKSVIEEELLKQHPSRDKIQPSEVSIEKFDDEDDADDWLKEEDEEETGVPVNTSLPIGNEEDVSFSDLEEDDDDHTK
ncbi:uncharacterized protein LOC109704526 [Ananas comosus]|uniref:Uncharacterized protein LOC109704526 n=1 Tax=Ananas comosus TaxID=4615 RepID=A0A6P5EC34_ANACO|nr:uncharacterized protein LOC109704526 [Ananas comosus]